VGGTPNYLAALNDIASKNYAGLTFSDPQTGKVTKEAKDPHVENHAEVKPGEASI
jgi:hypothetical protein